MMFGYATNETDDTCHIIIVHKLTKGLTKLRKMVYYHI